MKHRFIATLLMFAAIATSAMAQTSFIMNDGSRYEGYILEQPGAMPGNFVISTDCFKLVVPAEYWGGESRRRFVRSNDLDMKWVEWAQKNEAWNYDEDGYTGLYFQDVTLKDGRRTLAEYKNAHVISNGVDYEIQVMTDRPQKININPAEIEVEYLRPAKLDDESRVVRRYTLKGSDDNNLPTIEGQLVEVVPGSTYKVMQADGMITKINKSDILIEEVILDPTATFSEQFKVIDVLVKGGGEQIKGVIFSKDYRNGVLRIFTTDGQVHVEPFSSIATYKKEL